LGVKEARFQSLLAQALREDDFDVVVESYLSRDSKKKFFLRVIYMPGIVAQKKAIG
jgi:hypothetical protein